MKFASAFDPLPVLLRRPLMKTLERALPGGLPGRLTGPLRNAKKFARSAAFDFENRYLGYGTYFTDERKQKLYTDDLRLATQGLDAYVAHRRYFAKGQNAAPLNRLLYVDFKTFLPCLNLITTDKTSMAANLEVRVPFLNREMIELSVAYAAEPETSWLHTKIYFETSSQAGVTARGRLAKEGGFWCLDRSWLRGALRPLVADLLSEETVKRRGLFRPSEVQRIINDNLSGREDFNLQVFQLLTFELWYRQFLD